MNSVKASDPKHVGPSPLQDASAIEIAKLSLGFITNRKSGILPVLDSIDLQVRPSEFVAIVGPSGCGKTTILRVIGGLLEQTDTSIVMSGSVSVKGMSTTEAKAARLFGFAFQNPVLLPWRSVRQNVELPLELSGSQNVANSDAVRDLLQLMDVHDFDDAYPHQLSGGMQQRVNIARALVHQPSVLLLDEPFGALDEVTRERLNLVLLKIHRVKRPTILFVTHSLREAVFLSDRIVILGKRPAKIKAVLDSTLPRERNESTQMDRVFLDLWSRAKEIFFQVDGSQ